MATIYTTAIQELYVAYFNRPADAAGLAFWEGVVAANNGDTAAVSAAFAASAEYQTEYNQLTTAGVVTQIYQNLFNRAPEAAGLAYWVKALQDKLVTIDQAVAVIANGAQGSDMVAFDSKVLVATAFTAALDTDAEKAGYNGELANDAAKALLASITTATQAAAAIVPATLDASVAAVIKAGVPFSLTTALNDLVAAQDAKAAFLVEADGDDDEDTSATDAEITDAVATAEATLAGEITTGVYADASPGVKAALLADEVKLRNDALVAAQTKFTNDTAAVAKVAGLSSAIATLTSATAAAKAAAAALVTANGTLAGAVATYNTVNDSVSGTTTKDVTLTVETDGTASFTTVTNAAGVITTTTTQAIILEGTKLVINPDLTAAQKTGISAVFNASVAVEAAEKTVGSANIAQASAQTALNRTDFGDAAADELAAVASAMHIVKLAAGAVPTAAQITTEISALAAIRAAAETSFEASEGGVVTFAANGTATFTPTGGEPVALIVLSGSTLALDPAFTEGANPGVTALLNASIAAEAFDAAVAAFDSADTTNPLSSALTASEAAVKTATAQVAELAGVVADLAEAKALVAQLDALDDAIAAASAVFEENDFAAPITVAGVIGASIGSDIYVAGENNATIVAFGTSGDDMLYIGTDYTLNTGAVATAGNNAVLEVFLTQSGADTIVTLETEPFGSNSAESEIVITLTGVNVADVSLVNGIITVA